MESRKNKQALRSLWQKKRSSISAGRRFSAEKTMTEKLPSLMKNDEAILSYASFSSELSTLKLNHRLAAEGRLVLPRVVDQTLELYRIYDLENSLKLSSLGILEPDPALCETISPKEIGLTLVPGLVFDRVRMRLGYGKGLYDRLLSRFSPSTKTIGIGFHEQLLETPIPIESHDIRLHRVVLY